MNIWLDDEISDAEEAALLEYISGANGREQRSMQARRHRSSVADKCQQRMREDLQSIRNILTAYHTA